jgi:hypothetical protein
VIGAEVGVNSNHGAGKQMCGFAFEKHYRVRELASLWGLSSKTVARIFADEAGVIRIANEGTGKRKYATLSIPESVALRVHERLGNQPFQASLAGGHPLRIIRLSDLDAGMSEKTRNVIKLHSTKKSANRESIP